MVLYIVQYHIHWKSYSEFLDERMNVLDIQKIADISPS